MSVFFGGAVQKYLFLNLVFAMKYDLCIHKCICILGIYTKYSMYIFIPRKNETIGLKKFFDALPFNFINLRSINI